MNYCYRFPPFRDLSWSWDGTLETITRTWKRSHPISGVSIDFSIDSLTITRTWKIHWSWCYQPLCCQVTRRSQGSVMWPPYLDRQSAGWAGRWVGWSENFPYPIGSMYGIFTYIWLIFMVNVAKYTIHGSYGYVPWQFLGGNHRGSKGSPCAKFEFLNVHFLWFKGSVSQEMVILLGWCWKSSDQRLYLGNLLYILNLIVSAILGLGFPYFSLPFGVFPTGGKRSL